MSVHRPLDILKEAILLELRGQAFYQKVADQTQHEAVRTFFQTMSDEERRHIEVLSEQFKAYTNNHAFVPMDLTPNDAQSQPLADLVLSESLQQQIAGAGFEAAAISAAMLMEERAVALYKERAEVAQDEQEKALFQWLADWEHGHLAYLVQVDKEIKAAVWEDQKFWPF